MAAAWRSDRGRSPTSIGSLQAGREACCCRPRLPICHSGGDRPYSAREEPGNARAGTLPRDRPASASSGVAASSLAGCRTGGRRLRYWRCICPRSRVRRWRQIRRSRSRRRAARAGRFRRRSAVWRSRRPAPPAAAAGAVHRGLGDGVSGTLSGLAGGTQVLYVCVDQGGGPSVHSGGRGGGASGVSMGSDFSSPVLVAGGGGGGGAFGGGAGGGSAGMPVAQAGANSVVGGGGGGDNITAKVARRARVRSPCATVSPESDSAAPARVSAAAGAVASAATVAAPAAAATSPAAAAPLPASRAPVVAAGRTSARRRSRAAPFPQGPARSRPRGPAQDLPR